MLLRFGLDNEKQRQKTVVRGDEDSVVCRWELCLPLNFLRYEKTR